jgi:HAD superfamily hydrolase (TIGR01450 family)
MSLIDSYDCILLDLDGVVYLGKTPVDNAVKTIKELQKRKINIAVITNNGSVTAKSVSKWMKDFGLDIKPSSIITSSQTLCWYLQNNYAKSAKILVVGSDALKESVSDAGFKVVEKEDKDPMAVVNGIAPDIAQKNLAEMCYAISKNIPWIPTNGDYTFPTEKGLAPGNGAINALITSITGKSPILMGKPEPHMFQQAAKIFDSQKPIVVGDRLDTDIQGANNAGFKSLCVLTGVSDMGQIKNAPASTRPTYVGKDLSALIDNNYLVSW